MPIKAYLVLPSLMRAPLILYSNISFLKFLFADPAAIIFSPANPGPKIKPIGNVDVSSWIPFDVLDV